MSNFEKKDIRGLIGLAQRARKLAIGRYAVIQAVKSDEAQLVILAEDASQKLNNELDAINPDVKKVVHSTKHKLGALLGRKELALIAVCDVNFAREIQKIIAENEE